MSAAARVLCALEEIPDGGARGLQLFFGDERLSLVAVRRGGQAWVYRNRCPHFSVPLDFRPGEFCTYRGEVLMCAHHSALFRFEDGLCIDGPCAGAALEGLHCRVEAGLLLLLGD
ncbi:Rieske (2Fe-2S) protein [Pseudomonas aeruginosa]|uniref:Rieske (2Fe-2S) protein n=2 Tax=Pseudomonas aeruginosa TaxID=287 RepID=UPI0003BB38E7|nr:Rieske 2Fe-2S domain-containing protein [Pseudomonas aeruginosa]EKV4568617.1 Rieske 2Fe-2S domain-containing protein [Pseudomonas aeruginosa]ERX35848.1 hypothetical protein Q010_03097 [Pseudomonas aeruginosa 19660]KSD29715.1 4-nitrocatechol monooxygenase [Pseudomonas aeruginosa]KSM45056.1 4-nitrocatechol monooxygenase [Pseudomonas aeruginosa]MBH8875732.1 Rieske 2Fe-2S domain-containing protein [Pseudomonas aeruginosa]